MSGEDCAEELKKYINVDTRVSVLGHMQRGGSPSGIDRVLASRFGAYAVDLLMNDESGLAVGIQNNKLTKTKFEDIFSSQHKIDEDMYRLTNELSI